MSKDMNFGTSKPNMRIIAKKRQATAARAEDAKKKSRYANERRCEKEISIKDYVKIGMKKKSRYAKIYAKKKSRYGYPKMRKRNFDM